LSIGAAWRVPATRRVAGGLELIHAWIPSNARRALADREPVTYGELARIVTPSHG